MTRIMGEYTHNLDQKNRLQIPAKMRTELGESFVLTVSPNGDQCLLAYAFEDWDFVMEQLSNEVPSRETMNRQRMIYMNTDKIDLDAQGRMTIPTRFMEKAGFKQEVYMLGCGTHLELWDPTAHTQWLEDNEESIANQKTFFGR